MIYYYDSKLNNSFYIPRNREVQVSNTLSFSLLIIQHRIKYYEDFLLFILPFYLKKTFDTFLSNQPRNNSMLVIIQFQIKHYQFNNNMISEVEFNHTDQQFFKTFREKTINAHKKSITAFDWNTLGNKLASADNLIKLWNYQDSTGLTRFNEYKGHQNNIQCLKWSDPNVFLTVSKEALKIWDIRENKNIRQDKNEKKGKPDFTKAAWSPDGMQFALANKDNLISLFDKRQTLAIDSFKFENQIDQFMWDLTQSIIIVATWENIGNVVALDCKSKLTIAQTFPLHAAKINCLAIDPQNYYLATGGQDAIINLMELQEFICIRSYHKTDGAIHKISFSYDSKSLAVSNEQCYIDIYNVNNGSHSFRLQTTNPQNTINWHPKKFVLAFVDEQDKKKSNEQGVIRLFSP